jgi:hypothetical protein
MSAPARVLGLLALLALAGCGQDPMYKNKDYAAMNPIAMNSTCFGRFEVSIPRGGAKDWQTDVDWAQMTRLPLTLRSADDFWGYVEARKQFLQSQKHATEPSLLSYYEKVGDHAAMLLHRKDPSNKSTFYLERYLWLGDRGYFFKSLGQGEKVKARLEGFKQIFTRLVPHGPNGMPAAQGVCLDGATLTGVIPQISNRLVIRPVKLKGAVLFFGTSESADPTTVKDTPGLDERTMSAIGNLEIERQKYDYLKVNTSDGDPGAPKSFEVLRKGSRTIAGRSGEEVVWRTHYHNGAVTYHFLWMNADKAPSTPKNPSLTVDFQVGDEMDPSIKPPPEPQLFGVWDATLESVKPRY